MVYCPSQPLDGTGWARPRRGISVWCSQGERNDVVDALTDGVVAERGDGRDEGFTLIELLIVIIILGILSVVVVISVSGITNRGEESACEADERAVRTAAEAYFASNGNYPVDMAQMVDEQFLSDASTLHTYDDVPSGNQPYTITGVGECAGQPTG